MTLIRFFIISFHLFEQMLRYAFFRTGYALFVWDREKLRAKVERLRALCFTDFFRNLGATFIKIGQILSSRPDILPEYIIDELKLLQDQVPPFDFVHVEQTFKEDFGKGVDEVFEKINREPIAAASIAQVHEAWLSDGRHAAVKVRRPDIERGMERDLSVLLGLAWVFDRLPYLNVLRLSPQVESFGEAIRAQLDFTREAENNRRFDKHLKEMEFVHFPEIYDDYCTGRIITMEFVTGKKLDEVLVDPPIERPVLAERLFDFYSEMIYGHQFIHADLHPGNVLIDERGHFTLLDTGLVVEMPKYYVKRFLRLVLATATMDGAILLKTYLEDREGEPLSPETLAEAETEALEISKQFQGKTVAELEFGKIIFEMFALLRKYHIWMERELTMMFVSDITVEGMAKALDPDFDMPSFFQRKGMKYIAKMDWLKPEDFVFKFYQQPSNSPSGS
ncbi:MAG: AarF/ABC1/UbiB kinase family protein [Chrysiogenetes bacterium]|nr:AarF/ABC1/UbiB kinase family protein [Chrysiogenetes bacterium]